MCLSSIRTGRGLSIGVVFTILIAGSSLQGQAVPQGQATPAAAAPQAAPAELPSAKSIIDRHIEASGGRAALMARSSSHVVGTLAIPANGMKGKLEIFAAKPNKMLSKTSLEGIGEILEGFDGTVGWTINPMTGPLLSSPKEVEQKKIDLDFYGDLNVEKKYKTIKTLEKTTFEGRPVYKVALTKHDGTDDIQYFDAETGLKAGSQATRETPMGAITATVTVAEYKKFGGFLAPAKIKQSTMGVEMILTFDTIEHDNVDPAVFDLPPAIKALIK